MNQSYDACTAETKFVNELRAGAGHATRLDRAIWLLVASLPITFALLTWPISDFAFQDVFLRHFSLPVLALELIVFLYALSDGFEVRRSVASAPAWVKIALATLALIAVGTATLVAADKPTAIIRTATSGLHVLFALSLLHLYGTRFGTIRTVVWPSIAIGCLGYVLILAAYVATIPHPETFDWVFFKLAVTHVRQVGFFSVIGASVALGLAIGSAEKRSHWMWLAVAALSIAISFWSGTRSSLFAFVGAYFVGTRMFPTLRRLRAATALATSLLAGLTLSFLHQAPHSAFGFLRLWESSTSSNPGSGRFGMWLGTLRVYLERPLFGFGESQFRFLVPEALKAFNHPHNWVVQILFQWGLIGAVCYFALAIYTWARFERRVAEIGNPAMPAYFVVTSLLLYSLVEGTMYHPYPVAMLVVAIAWVLAAPGTRKGAARLPAHRPFR